MPSLIRTFVTSLAAAIISLFLFSTYVPATYAAANMFVAGSGNFSLGQTVTVNITVNTSGASANAFQGNFTYPAGLFEGVRGTYSGSICTLPILVPEPNGGSAPFSCGRPAGFTGTGVVATVVLKAVSNGSGTFGLSGCQVLANDGQGTNITGGCTGLSVAVADAPTPPPTPTPGLTPTPAATPSASFTATPSQTRTPRPSTSPRTSPTPLPTLTPRLASPTPSQVLTAAETPTENTPTPEPQVPGVQELDDPEPTPTPNGTTEGENPSQEQRTIGQALQDILKSASDLSTFQSSPAGVIAVMITTIPFLALIFGIIILLYRLYMIDRRRRRTLERLFEMELAELASLEGKLDLLAEKGTKGREQFKEEFQRAKENILRQIKPDFAKPVEKPATSTETPAEAPKEAK